MYKIYEMEDIVVAKEKGSSEQRRIIAMLFFSSALAFISLSVHSVRIQNLILFVAVALFCTCIVLLIRSKRKNKVGDRNDKSSN